MAKTKWHFVVQSFCNGGAQNKILLRAPVWQGATLIITHMPRSHLPAVLQTLIKMCVCIILMVFLKNFAIEGDFQKLNFQWPQMPFTCVQKAKTQRKRLVSTLCTWGQTLTLLGKYIQSELARWRIWWLAKVKDGKPLWFRLIKINPMIGEHELSVITIINGC